jgi:regulator of ribonuclease activity A
MTFSIATLCDTYWGGSHNLQIADPVFKNFGGIQLFSGQITTLKTFEDSVIIRKILSEKVENRILVIDGGGSHRCALIDFNLARIATDNGWGGIVVYGCIRESALIAKLPIGLLALHTHPLHCNKKEQGDRDLLISFAGINFKKDSFLYADMDGMIVSDSMLS